MRKGDKLLYSTRSVESGPARRTCKLSCTHCLWPTDQRQPSPSAQLPDDSHNQPNNRPVLHRSPQTKTQAPAPPTKHHAVTSYYPTPSKPQAQKPLQQKDDSDKMTDKAISNHPQAGVCRQTTPPGEDPLPTRNRTRSSTE